MGWLTRFVRSARRKCQGRRFARRFAVALALQGEHTEEEKMDFLKRLNEAGVKNIEMEATALAAITKAAGVRSGNVCVTIVNRLKGDQVTFTKEELTQFALRPQKLVATY